MEWEEGGWDWGGGGGELSASERENLGIDWAGKGTPCASCNQDRGRGVKTTSIEISGFFSTVHESIKRSPIYLSEFTKNDFITLLTHIIIPANFKLL